MFDYFSVTMWIIITSFFSMLTAIFNYFDEWYYSVVGAIHILVTLYIIYRLLFIPFYEVWRNSIALAFGITTIL
ncbi:hypothetical protein TVAG_162110 [Trichomonas vaginalis G3]|uniref:Uncharacterized protein n=1 Tax=Trichomonas vaginalis (strain ATCC PRA-98 / G3) TaxID=412133 RepID=A2FBV9_TRIV3|nr:guanylate cyclase protein [Trichomonas vaginalis G3]EAX97605.1 hypothetical protein TVAG_162110 [Trichomonas vaginalis G3]KAI5510581.1 guanylate cyclase protein [Trichomonas vaginalis G3]|eukprot:XP_001310535.1 hypothetical protein [Trichomonas vaginalis G3]